MMFSFHFFMLRTQGLELRTNYLIPPYFLVDNEKRIVKWKNDAEDQGRCFNIHDKDLHGTREAGNRRSRE